MKRIVIIGATSCIAENCARIWVEEPVKLILVGRNQSKLDSVSQDLMVRSPQSRITTRIIGFENPVLIEMLVAELYSSPVDIALIAHGSLPDQQKCQHDLALSKEMLEINGVSPVLFAEAFAKEMEKLNYGSIVLIGSVAGDRGRKSNYVYGAGKGLVARYAEGLQHRFAGTGVKVVLVKPGPTDTPMTHRLKESGARLATAESVAKQIVMGVESGKLAIYAPKKWWLIMRIIRHLPDFVFNKMNI